MTHGIDPKHPHDPASAHEARMRAIAAMRHEQAATAHRIAAETTKRIMRHDPASTEEIAEEIAACAAASKRTAEAMDATMAAGIWGSWTDRAIEHAQIAADAPCMTQDAIDASTQAAKKHDEIAEWMWASAK